MSSKTLTTRPSKQRKRLFNSKLHTRRKHLAAPLSKELRAKHGTRSMPVRVGDKVKVVRGQYRGSIGKVDRTSLAHFRVYVDGVHISKTNGAKTHVPLHPSNLIITDLVLSDKKRVKVQDSPKAKPAKSDK